MSLGTKNKHFSIFMIQEFQHPTLGSLKVEPDMNGRTWFCLKDVTTMAGFTCMYIRNIPKVNDVIEIPVKEGAPQKLWYASPEGLGAVLTFIKDKDPENEKLDEIWRFAMMIRTRVGKHGIDYTSYSNWVEPVRKQFDDKFLNEIKDIERSVIGTMMLHPEFFDFKHLGHLYDSTLFRSRSLGIVYARMMELYDYFGTVNKVLLIENLRSSGAFSENDLEETVSNLVSCSCDNEIDLYKKFGFLVVNNALNLFLHCYDTMALSLEFQDGVSAIFALVESAMHCSGATMSSVQPFEHFVLSSAKFTPKQKSEILAGWKRNCVSKCYNEFDLFLYQKELMCTPVS